MKWAYVQDFSGLKNGSPSEYSDLQTNTMTKQQKSDLLHAVSASAFSELADDADPSRIPKTDDEIKKERLDDAESIDKNLSEIEEKSFSAKELSDFSAMESQNAKKTFDDRTKSKDESHEVKAPHQKDFYEEIYDKSAKR
jgi:hypothetical protein